MANSRKLSGRCIAGKEVLTEGLGGWIRPVSSRATGEVSELDRRFANGKYPQVLDIVTIPMTEHRPHAYQQENYLIDEDSYWEKAGAIDWDGLVHCVDDDSELLWENGYSGYYGVNDRIPEEIANGLGSSLKLIQPQALTVCIETEGVEFGNGKRKVRALFSYNNNQYKLAITDPRIESYYLGQENGRYDVDSRAVFMCVSIGEPYKGFCYKLVASVIAR